MSPLQGFYLLLFFPGALPQADILRAFSANQPQENLGKPGTDTSEANEESGDVSVPAFPGFAPAGPTKRGKSSLHVSPATIRYEVGLSMKLSERKQKLIDTCRALRSAATDASPPENVSLAEMMQAVLAVAGNDPHDDVEYDEDKAEPAKTRPLERDPGQPLGWTPPPPRA